MITNPTRAALPYYSWRVSAVAFLETITLNIFLGATHSCSSMASQSPPADCTRAEQLARSGQTVEALNPFQRIAADYAG